MSLDGSVLILVAFVETGLILAGFLAFQCQRGKIEKMERNRSQDSGQRLPLRESKT
jgi:hypothetical protein